MSSQNKAIISFGNKVLGTATGISFSVQKNIQPQYDFESINPIGFSDGIQIVVGSLEFQVLDSTVLKDFSNLDKSYYSYSFNGKIDEGLPKNQVNIAKSIFDGVEIKKPDELPPLDLNIYNVRLNEDGTTDTIAFKISNVEITSYVLSISVADVVAIEQVSFIGLDYKQVKI